MVQKSTDGYDKQHGSFRYSAGRICLRRLIDERVLEAPLESDLTFSLDSEDLLHDMWKSLGFGVEQQVGDPCFDQDVYIHSDQPSVGKLLSENESLRDLIKRLIEKVHSIEVTGTALRVRMSGTTDLATVLDDIAALHASLAALLQSTSSSMSEKVIKSSLPWVLFSALAVRLALWLALGLCIFICLNPRGALLAPERVGLIGMAIGVAGFVGLLLGVKGLFRGSSSAPRIANRVALVSVAFPFLSFAAIKSINVSFDTSPGWRVPCIVESLGRGFSVRVSLAPGAPRLPFSFRRTIEIDRKLFSELKQGSAVTVDIGAGAFGFPYYRAVSISDRPAG